MANVIETTENLEIELASIQDRLKSGTISNTVARTLILAIRSRLDVIKIEMEAARLGADFGAVALRASNRKSNLKAVA